MDTFIPKSSGPIGGDSRSPKRVDSPAIYAQPLAGNERIFAPDSAIIASGYDDLRSPSQPLLTNPCMPY
jgi:hypothetical protein